MMKLDRYDSLFKFYASGNGLDWRLLRAQAEAESNLNPRAISRVGAEGIAQFMPNTWREIMEDADPFNPESSIQAQAIYMGRLMTRYPGDIVKALAAYNWGMGNVDRAVKQHGAIWLTHAPAETRAYVARIMDRHRALQLVPGLLMEI